MSMYYYNKECLPIDEFCAIDGFTKFNETHCEKYDSAMNKTTVEKATKAIQRLSSSEDYYK